MPWWAQPRYAGSMAISGEFGVSVKWWLRLALVPLAAGCAGQSAETERQLATMNERLVVLQNDRDRLMERVDALETQKPGAGNEAEDVSSLQGAPAQRPRLKVVRLEPALPSAAGETQTTAEVVTERSYVEATGSPDPGGSQDEAVPASVPPTQPKVVLYGEGATSGVRPSEGAVAQ